MGIDCGFDMHPRLDPNNPADLASYRDFVAEIIQAYRNKYDKDGRREDGKVLILPSDCLMPADHFGALDRCSITFAVGEYPRIPANPQRCNYFLRFSSKVSGPLTYPARNYIVKVCAIARKYFADRVQVWDEGCDQFGFYNWKEVTEAEGELLRLEAKEDE